MIVIDPALIGRKYHTTDHKTVYTLRGVYAQTNGKPIVMGELPTDPNTINAPTKLVTHTLAEINLHP